MLWPIISINDPPFSLHGSFRPTNLEKKNLKPCCHCLSFVPFCSSLINLFETTSRPSPGWNFTKLHRNNPWIVLYQRCSKISIPCRILVAMVTEINIFKNLLKKIHETLAHLKVKATYLEFLCLNLMDLIICKPYNQLFMFGIWYHPHPLGHGNRNQHI